MISTLSAHCETGHHGTCPRDGLYYGCDCACHLDCPHGYSAQTGEYYGDCPTCYEEELAAEKES